jgi:hypothetical protein
MKLGYIEVSGIRRIVEGRKVVWERYADRWVKFVDKKHMVVQNKKGQKTKSERVAVTGMSDVEMHDYLDDKVFDTVLVKFGDERRPVCKNRVWLHGDTINIVRNQ